MAIKTGGGCWDITDEMDAEPVLDAYSLLVSGKSGYKAVIERRKEPIKCKGCSCNLKGVEKFCPECGTKIEAKN